MNAAHALEKIGSLTVGARVVGELAGGPASASYLVERDADRWVLRLDTDVPTGLGLDRSAEASVLGHIYKESETAIGPRLEFFDAAEGIQLTRYIAGTPWTERDVAAPENLQRLAGLLKRVHSLGAVGRPFALHDKISGYADIVGTATATDQARKIRALLQELDRGDACLCHNDVVAANVIDGDRLYLVDWEYAAVGDPMFDLAIVAQHHELSRVARDALLAAYFGQAADADFRRLNDWCRVYDGLVRLWQSAVDELTFG